MRREDLDSESVPHNPLLFRILHRMNPVEQFDSSIRRICDAGEEQAVYAGRSRRLVSAESRGPLT